MWLFLIFMHLVGSAGYNLVLRKSLVAKADKLTLATVMQTSVAIPMLVALLVSPPSVHLYDLPIVLVILTTTALVIMLHLTNVKALYYLEAGIYSILYNLRIVFATVLGVLFLGEDILPLQILGGLLIFLGIATFRINIKSTITSLGLRWGIAASVVISILNMLEKSLISQIGYLGYAVLVMLLAAVIMWGLVLYQGRKINLSYFKEPETLQLMALRATSAYGFTLAFSAGAVLSVATYVSSISVIIIVLLGMWLLKERDHIKQKLTATAMAVLGLSAILVANLYQ